MGGLEDLICTLSMAVIGSDTTCKQRAGCTKLGNWFFVKSKADQKVKMLFNVTVSFSQKKKKVSIQKYLINDSSWPAIAAFGKMLHTLIYLF